MLSILAGPIFKSLALLLVFVYLRFMELLFFKFSTVPLLDVCFDKFDLLVAFLEYKLFSPSVLAFFRLNSNRSSSLLMTVPPDIDLYSSC